LKLYIFQLSIAPYRVPFFDKLDSILDSELAVVGAPAKSTLDKYQDLYERRWLLNLKYREIRVFQMYWITNLMSLRFEKSDVVIFPGTPRVLSFLVLSVKARLAGCKVLWWSHLYSSTSKAHRSLVRLGILSLTDGAIFYTEDEERVYQNKFPAWFRTKSHSANNGIDISDISEYKKTYNSELRENIILFIGRLNGKDKLDLLLHAVSKTGRKDITIAAIGDGLLLEKYKKLAEKLEIDQQVTWYGEIRDEKQISTIVNTAKIFVYPGAVGLSLMHAFAYGIPAIVHDNRQDHMPEICVLANGINGSTFRYKDVESLRYVIVSTLSNSAHLNTMSINASSIVQKKYNTKLMAENIARIVRSLNG